MASTRAAVAVGVLLVVAGCAGFPGVDEEPESAESVEHHELVLASDLTPYEATVTVETDGETVLERSIESEGPAGYTQLGTLEEPGPYLVTVNTSIETYEGNLSGEVRVDGDPGNATVLVADYRGITPARVPLPRERAEHSMSAYSYHVNIGGSSNVTLDYRVWYRGERLADDSVTVTRDNLTGVVSLERTGVYHVSLRAAGDWENETVVLADPEQSIVFEIDAQGYVSDIKVRPASG